MTKQHSLQFEYRTKHILLKEGKNLPVANAKKTLVGKAVHPRVKKLLTVACLKRWSKKCTTDAEHIPLELRWFDDSHKPHSKDEYLPSYVIETIVPHDDSNDFSDDDFDSDDDDDN